MSSEPQSKESPDAVSSQRRSSFAGLLQAADAGLVDRGQTIVCTVTGNGLKDPEWAISGAPTPVSVPVDAHVAATELGLAD